MANQYAIQDPNRFPALLGHTGTANTAETVRLTAGADGALNVNLSGTEPIELVAGTVTRLLNVGTIESGTIKTIDSLAPYVYDTINVTYPTGTTELYAYLSGTSSLGTITVVYTDSTKGSISSVTKTP